MRCRICDTMDAEHLDKKDGHYYCDSCKGDIEKIIYEQEVEDETSEGD